MMNYIVRRLLIAIPILFGITIINFLVINMAPGSPIDSLIDPSMTEEMINQRKAALSLDQPLYVQYGYWIANLLQGNFGYSYTTYESVAKIIGERMGPTVLLMGSALLVAVIIAIPLGVLSAVKNNSWVDHSITGVSFLGISVPNFFLALTLIYIFGVHFNLLPTGGMFTIGQDPTLVDRIRHLILPVMVLASGLVGSITRYVRSSVIEILGQEYLRTARSKGLSEFLVINKHALRNALIPVITVVGMLIPSLFGGAVIIEQLFSWPGMGQLMITSISSRDYPTLMMLNLISAVIVLGANLLTDITYTLVDPRIKHN